MKFETKYIGGNGGGASSILELTIKSNDYYITEDILDFSTNKVNEMFIMELTQLVDELQEHNKLVDKAAILEKEFISNCKEPIPNDAPLSSEYWYKDGSLNGLTKRWYSNGQLEQEVRYKDGKENGLMREWYSNGQLYIECSYKDGEYNGSFRRWDEYGTLRKTANYKDGVPNGMVLKWHFNGQLKSESTYKNGKKIKEL